MFKTAATKIAHNSTLPALGGNQDLRPLQDLITAEKAVLIALQKLSVDYSKASEALRTWGLNEGDDLGDILSASTTILNHFSSALSQYASHGHVMRDQLKAIRTREEALEDLRRRRRTVVRKAEDADKKLSKMSPEHKNLAMQTETLNRLRDEIRTMDSDIMTEEAALGDFKRTSTRMWMGLKFGGLLEMCEKGTIVAEFGKMLVGEISEEITQPGLPRSLYYGHSKTENYVAEAHRCINDVVLSTVPSVGFRDRQQYENRPQEVSGYQPGNDGYNMNSTPWTPTESKPQPPPPIRSSNDYPMQRPSGSDDVPRSPVTASGSSFQNQPNQFQQQYAPRPEQQTMDDFGVSNRSAGLVDNSNTSGGRFATFPVKRPVGSNGGYSLQDPPTLGPRHDQGSSFADSIAAALDGQTESTSHATDGAHNQGGSYIAGRFIPGPPSSYGGTEETTRAAEGPPSIIGQPQYSQGARPSYDASPNSPIGSTAPSSQRQFISELPPLPLPPPGAAPPTLSDPWAGASREGSLQPQAASHNRNVSEISGNDDLLAYMTTPQSEPPSPINATLPTNSNSLTAASEEEQQRISRHVRFGDIKDVEGQVEKRESLEKAGLAQESNIVENNRKAPPDYTPISIDVDKPPNQVPESNNESQGPLSPTSTSSSTDTGKPKSYRIPPPAFKPEEDEKALDAAAAREVTRELEALKGSPPKPSEMGQQSQTEPIQGDRGRPSIMTRGYSDQPSDNSTLPPPAAPFAKRAVSPHPYAELNDNVSPPYSGQYTSAQLYAQSYQNPSPYGTSAPSSPAQTYAQTYQNSHAADPHPTSTIPPRFQALNQDIQVPPRFQGSRSHSPGSPTANQLPPRFQAGGAPQIPPPSIALPETESRFGQSKGTETPYRTPPEYPRGLSNSPYTKSTSSLNTNSPVGSSAPRTISAAAFKRPRNASVGLDNQGDPFTKKTLPSSPYPIRDPPALAPAGERTTGPVNNAGPNSLPPGAGPPGTNARKSILDDDEYDYISAYVNNSNPNSPQQPEFEHNAPQDTMTGVGAGNAAGVGAGGRGGGGYNDGRFATDLENGSLR